MKHCNESSIHSFKYCRRAFVACVLMGAARLSCAQPDIADRDYELAVLDSGAPGEVTFALPRRAIAAQDLLLVYNASQPESVAIKDCYLSRRNVPTANVVAVNAPSNAEISQQQADLIRDALDTALVGRDDIQAIAIAWRTPWRVDVPSFGSIQKRSITTYLGRLTETDNLLYDSATTRPWSDHGIRPVMAITPQIDASLPAPGVVCDESGVIARGVQADGTLPDGNGYLLRTSDVLRSIRYQDFIDTVDQFDDALVQLDYRDLQSGPNDVVINSTNITTFEQLEATGDFISGETDVMFHFTGLATVPGIASNSFLPGSFADHLTSGAGAITFRGGEFFGCSPEPCDPPLYSSTQMSALNWLENGATASFGNVAEPFATTTRFPNSRPLIESYLYGSTLLEAVAKSVFDPIVGLAIGEPLARAFSWRDATVGNQPALETAALRPGKVYSVWSGDDASSTLTRSRSNLIVDGPTVTTVRGTAGSGYVLLHEEPDPFFGAEFAREAFLTCSLQAPGGAVWCDSENRLWYRADGEERQLIAQSVATRNVDIEGNTLFWLGTTATAGSYELYSLELGNSAPVLLSEVAADVPVNLVASDALIVWSNTISLSFPEIMVFDRMTDQVFVQPTGDVLPWLGNQVAAVGDSIAFVGQDAVSGETGIFKTQAGQIPTLFEAAPTSTTDLHMNPDWMVWRVGGDVFVNDHVGSAVTEQIPNPWALDGDAAWLDLNGGVLSVVQNSGTGPRLWLQELATEATLLLPQSHALRLKGLQKNAATGSLQAKYDLTDYRPDGADLEAIEFSPFEVALAYDVSAATALHPSVSDFSVTSGESRALYVRPTDAFLRLGRYEYDVLPSDGADPATSGLSVSVRPIGDVNGDGAVNFLDYSAWTDAFLSVRGDANYNVAADFDNSGSVNFLDVRPIIDHFLDPDAAHVALVKWDSDGFKPGQSLAVEVRMTANQGAQLKKAIALSAE